MQGFILGRVKDKVIGDLTIEGIVTKQKSNTWKMFVRLAATVETLQWAFIFSDTGSYLEFIYT